MTSRLVGLVMGKYKFVRSRRTRKQKIFSSLVRPINMIKFRSVAAFHESCRCKKKPFRESLSCRMKRQEMQETTFAFRWIMQAVVIV